MSSPSRVGDNLSRMKGGRREGLRNSIAAMEKKLEEGEEGRRGAGLVGPLLRRPRSRCRCRRSRRGDGGGGVCGEPWTDRRKFRRVDGLVAVFAFAAAFLLMSAGKVKGGAEGPREGYIGGRTRKTPFKLRNGERWSLRRNRHKLGEFAGLSREAPSHHSARRPRRQPPTHVHFVRRTNFSS